MAKSLFKKGDIVALPTEPFTSHDIIFAPEMSRHLGKQGTIVRVDSTDDSYKIESAGDCWWWPYYSIHAANVKPKKSKKKKQYTRSSGHGTGVRFPLTVKLQAIALRNTGLTIRETAEKLNTSSQSIVNWEKQHKQGQFNEPIAFQRNCKMIRS